MRVLPKPATGASQLSCPATSPPVPMSPLVRGRVSKPDDLRRPGIDSKVQL